MSIGNLTLLRYCLSVCGTVFFILFALAHLHVFATNLPKEKVATDLQEDNVRFNSTRAMTIIDWKANRPLTCLWSINLTSLQINEILLDQAFTIGEDFEIIVPILEGAINDTDSVIECTPMRYEAIDLRRRVEVVTGYDETRDQKLSEYVNSISRN